MLKTKNSRRTFLIYAWQIVFICLVLLEVFLLKGAYKTFLIICVLAGFAVIIGLAIAVFAAVENWINKGTDE